MAITCSECSAALAPGVKECPECGSEVGHYSLSKLSEDRERTRPAPAQNGSSLTGIIYLACALLVMTVTALVMIKPHWLFRSHAGHSTNQPDAMPITVGHLTADYTSDAVTADETYRGKLLQVTGTYFAALPLRRDPTITSVHLSEDSGATFVQCLFNKQDSGPLAALHQGEQVTIRGLNSGRGSTQHAVLHDCQLQQSGSN